METRLVHPSLLVESFPKIPRTQSEASQFSGSHNYKTKQNKTNYLLKSLEKHSSLRKLGRVSKKLD
jgi:hypothetical protein